MTQSYVPARGLPEKVSRRITQWRRARPAHLRFDAPLLSICFDDFPVSAAHEGAAIVEAHGARATFYASAALSCADGPCGPNFTAEDARALERRGHEIACHSFAHADLAKRPVFETLKDLARNREALTEMGLPAPQTLAYPYGETSFALKQALPPRYACARGILPGLNIGPADLLQLRAYPLFGARTLARAHAALKRASRRKAWMIAFTHDVGDAPSAWGVARTNLDALLVAAHRLGVTVLPVRTALSRRLH